MAIVVAAAAGELLGRSRLAVLLSGEGRVIRLLAHRVALRRLLIDAVHLQIGGVARLALLRVRLLEGIVGDVSEGGLAIVADDAVRVDAKQGHEATQHGGSKAKRRRLAALFNKVQK